MDPFLLKILVLINILLVISTVVNVIHKLEIIQGPNAHIAIAILSILVLFGYSGVLNTVFLKRRFHRGRIVYLLVAGASQLTILILSFLSYYNVMTYFLAIAIIHAIMGFITMVNFTCAVIVVYEQQLQIEEDENTGIKKQLQMKIATLEYLTKMSALSSEGDQLSVSNRYSEPLLNKQQKEEQVIEQIKDEQN